MRILTVSRHRTTLERTVTVAPGEWWLSSGVALPVPGSIYVMPRDQSSVVPQDAAASELFRQKHSHWREIAEINLFVVNALAPTKLLKYQTYYIQHKLRSERQCLFCFEHHPSACNGFVLR